MMFDKYNTFSTILLLISSLALIATESDDDDAREYQEISQTLYGIRGPVLNVDEILHMLERAVAIYDRLKKGGKINNEFIHKRSQEMRDLIYAKSLVGVDCDFASFDQFNRLRSLHGENYYFLFKFINHHHHEHSRKCREALIAQLRQGVAKIQASGRLSELESLSGAVFATLSRYSRPYIGIRNDLLKEGINNYVNNRLMASALDSRISYEKAGQKLKKNKLNDIVENLCRTVDEALGRTIDTYDKREYDYDIEIDEFEKVWLAKGRVCKDILANYETLLK